MTQDPMTHKKNKNKHNHNYYKYNNYDNNTNRIKSENQYLI